ncbi:signal transduction histidine kinase [Mycena crocata]|nr:signal transduction histidine kinase [Mycena crocata]
MYFASPSTTEFRTEKSSCKVTVYNIFWLRQNNTDHASSALSFQPFVRLTMAPDARIEEDPSGTINVAAFNQILELDDEDTHAYSKDMIAMYFAQVPAAFTDMDEALAAMDLRKLADLAHFLMGSSATLGIARVSSSCARMEVVGEASLKAKFDKSVDTSNAQAQLGALLAEVKHEYADAETWLRRWYEEQGESFDEVKVDQAAAPTADSDSQPEADDPPAGAAVDISPPSSPPGPENTAPTPTAADADAPVTDAPPPPPRASTP